MTQQDGSSRDSRARRTYRVARGGFPAGLALGVALTLALIFFGGMPLALTRSSAAPLEEVYGKDAVALAVGRVAGDATNPLAGNAAAITAGAGTYRKACAGCHGSTGNGRGGAGEYFYPPASDLTAPDTQGKSDAELLWIIKNGLSFTGMPRYGTRMDDQRLWALVAYLRTLGPRQIP